jgi:hypothetical protein
MDDQSAAHEQLRAMLTTAARGLLLEARVFPLARKELPAQLELAGYVPLDGALRRTIDRKPHMDELKAALQILDASLEGLHTPPLAA